jgi:hypothetical protein
VAVALAVGKLAAAAAGLAVARLADLAAESKRT